ncbi:MAG: nitrilase-related carbon-nitrogen hydrolase [Spirochaetota bacterium]
MKVGLYQYAPKYHEKNANLDHVLDVLYAHQTDIAVLPELAFTGYTFSSIAQLFELSETVDGQSSNRLQEFSDQTDTAVVYGLPEYDHAQDAVFNSAVCIRPHQLPTVYRKAHLFRSEKLFFTPGNSPFTPLEYKDARLGLLVCYDHLYPEAARSLAVQGVQIICHPSNLVLPGTAQRTTLVRSIENRVFWILANRIGDDPEGEHLVHFTGSSQITGPDGTILAQAAADSQEFINIDITPSQADNKQITPYNNLFEDLRPDLYRS